jgi:hypothetical protein
MENDTMEKFKIEIPKQLESLLGPPPLLEGEDREAYLALQSLVIEEAQPKTVTDWIYVHDLVTQLWEEQRFRRASVAIIRGGMLAALEYYLQEIEECADFPDYGSFKKKARNYFSTDPKESKAVRSILEQHGITQSALQAKAAQLESNGVLMFERLVTARANARRKLRKEAKRYAGSRDHDDLAEE